MASTFTLKFTSDKGRYLELTCTQTKDIENNRSKIDWTLSSIGGSSNYYSTGPTTVKINGSQVYYKDRVSQSFPAAKGSTSGTTYVNHSSIGEAIITCSISSAIYTKSITTESDNWTLDNIPRAATITNAPNFDDENSFTVNYSNPAGSAVDSLAVGISLTGSIDDVPYRSVEKTGTSYTFNLTEAEKNTLRNATLSGTNSRTVHIFLRTIIGGVSYYDSESKTFTVINAAPTLDPTAIDTADLTVSLTGDGNKIIKGYNSVKVSSGAKALKGASIVSQSVKCENKSIASGDGSLDYVESGNFVFTVTDNRGLTTSKTISKTLIEYFSPSCVMSTKVTLDTSDEETTTAIATITFEGSFYNASFGAVNNEFILEYQIRNINDDYTDTWKSVAITPNGNDYTVSIEEKDLPYRETYSVRARYRDKIRYGNLYITEQIVKAVPVFDWSGEDFNFNVPITVEGMTFGKNNILWEGAALMGGGNVATLSAPISTQPHGIILVFSGFINNAPVNYYISSHVVPKALVTALPGAPHTFMFSGDATMAYVGAKYLYINDTSIGGHTNNEAVGTGVVSGIAYNNNRWVLRYVIGF